MIDSRLLLQANRIDNQVDRAMYFMTVLHAGQKDKVGDPYVWHPIRVAQTFVGADDTLTVGALLHDTVEDTDAELICIERLFGPEMASIVNSVSKLDGNGETYFQHIERAGRHPKGALIKRADLMDHFRPGANKSLRLRYTKALHILDEAMHK
jgi:(p)ppGpp synthase/HD superfamily hydrolase